MSLVFWAPLIRDTNSQGLLSVTPITVGTISFIDGGKIGKCLSAGTGSQQTNGISYNTNLVNELGTQFSCSIWVKPLGTHVHYNGTFVSSGNWNVKCWSFGVNQNNTKVDIFSKGYNRYLDCEVPVNTWTHLCCTSDNGTVKLYKNGVYVGQSTGLPESLDSDASNFCIGRETYASGYFSFNGNINDVRFYDEVLSQKQIKELSKGLVAHYKLDDRGQVNLLKNSNFTEGTNGLQGITATAGSTLTKQSDCLKVVSTGASYGFYTSNFDSITTGNMTTFSAWVKSDANMTIYIGTDGSGNGNCQSYTIGTSWQLISISKAKTTNNANLRIYGVGTFYVRCMKYELGDKITKWCPNSADSIYTTLGYNDITVYDCSGHNYHGSTLGTLTAASDTARYSSSTVFDGANSGVLIENINLSTIINTEITYSFWIKPNGESGARSVYFGSYSGTSWSIEKTTGNLLRLYWNGSPDETCTGVTISDGVWQHICIIKKGTSEIKVYINGELKWTSTASHADKAFPTTYRIGRDTRSSDGTPYKGQMSDFRIYSTALSADDVLELYNTSATIDKSGNMYSYELREV